MENNDYCTWPAFSFCLVCVLFLFFGHLPFSHAENYGPLVIGRATNKISKNYKHLNPIVTYLATKLHKEGISEGKVLIDGTNSDQKIIEYLKAGRIDIILESPFASALYMKETGAIPILLVQRKGHYKYSSYIFVRKDSRITTLEDLKGKIIAFEDPGSTSAYHWPKKNIEKMGLEIVPAQKNSPVFEDQIGYIFAGDELNISASVFYGKTVAGALSSVDWLDQEEMPQAFKRECKIIFETPKIPRMLVLVRRGVPERIRAKIQEELLFMHTDLDGKKALRPYNIDRFLSIDQATRTLVQNLAAE